MARNFTHALLYPEQLKKCLPGLTTNADEGLNAQFWRRSPKSSFVSLPSLKVSLYGAILCRNESYFSRADHFKSLNFMQEGIISNHCLNWMIEERKNERKWNRKEQIMQKIVVMMTIRQELTHKHHCKYHSTIVTDCKSDFSISLWTTPN